MNTPKKPTEEKSFLNSFGILLIVFCAALSFVISSEVIEDHLIQYTHFPSSLAVEVPDQSGKSVRFYLPVKTQQPIDTTKSAAQRQPADTAQSDTSRQAADTAQSAAPRQPADTNSSAVVKNILFHQNPAFLVWFFLICAMLSIAGGSAPFFIYKIIEMGKKFELEWWKIVISALYALMIGLLLYLTSAASKGFYGPPEVINDLHILFDDGDIITRLVGAVLLFILPGLAALFLIGVSSDSIRITAREDVDDQDKNSRQGITKAVKKIRLLNELLSAILQVFSVIVVFSVLTTSFLGLSIKSAVSVHGLDLFPKEMSYVYGLFFSLFLCILYVPIYYYLKNNYNRLKEMAADLDKEPEDEKWYTSLFGESKFEGTGTEQFKLALTIMAPLITGILPNAFDFMK